MIPQDIAEMTGVSQATVSVVLNGRSDSEVKIVPETRDRRSRAFADNGYVADPIARRLAARHNRILGVFTYEPVFPSADSDFCHPFLIGIDQRGEAGGCVPVGRSLDPHELAKLVVDGLPEHPVAPKHKARS